MNQKIFPVNFEDFYNDLLCELAKVSSIKTMTMNKENKIKIEERNIFVATKKSNPNYELIPIEFIKKAYNELLNNSEVTQSYLSETLYVKRSAFIMSAFSRLEYINYDEVNNSFKISLKNA
jgi:hypothetical protein